MSKVRVRTLFGESVRLVELSRGDNNYSALKDHVSNKHDLRSFSLKYISPAMGEVIVDNAESLHKVVKDAELRQVLAIELRVQSQEKQPPVTKASTPSSYPSAAATTVPRSPATPSSPATSYPSSASPSHPPSQSASSYSASPSSSNHVQGVIHTFVLAGDASSLNPDKVSVKAQQEDDHFLFVPQAAKYPSEVTVELEASKLSFQSTTKHPDGRIFQFKQGFALPFSTIPANTIDIQGNNIKISF